MVGLPLITIRCFLTLKNNKLSGENVILSGNVREFWTYSNVATMANEPRSCGNSTNVGIRKQNLNPVIRLWNFFYSQSATRTVIPLKLRQNPNARAATPTVTSNATTWRQQHSGLWHYFETPERRTLAPLSHPLSNCLHCVKINQPVITMVTRTTSCLAAHYCRSFLYLLITLRI